jgi:hypothetical protein
LSLRDKDLMRGEAIGYRRSMEAPLLLVSTARASEDAPLGLLGDSPTEGFLLVAALLGMLLLSRVHRKEREKRSPRRHDPLSPREMGHLVFQAARRGDLDLYRGLFLSGGEARALMGEGAVAYLDRRGPQVIEESLVFVGACIPDGSAFEGADLDDGHGLLLRVRLPDGTRIRLPSGVVARVGQLWRIVEPGFPRPEEPGA